MSTPGVNGPRGSNRTWMVGIDVGGTFTDLFFVDSQSGECHVGKLPTTLEDQSIALLEGIKRQASLDDVSTIVHGTTTGTNALLTRSGARIGVITTRGFRDVLEMRRRDRPNTWGLWGSFDPLASRDMRIEVTERTLANGEIKTPLDENEVREAAIQLRARGAQAVAIIFINAYANPEHEQRARDVVASHWEGDWINCSSDILPEIREFERASTTAVNAYLQPVVSHYFDALSDSVGRAGFAGSIFIVQSNGGVMTLDTARQLPVRTALSGPAAGVMAAAYIAREAGVRNVITCDLGGTSFDVSLVADGKSVLAPQTTVDFGLVIRTPMVEITTIGAGGGSIARVDAGGFLQVGPESAGSNPGPAAYGMGSELPTLTDANVLMGRINAARPIGREMKRLDIEAAEKAIEQHVGEPLGLSPLQAAEAIVTVATSRMAGAIRLVSIERGYDPKTFAIMPFGGGGGLHTGALMKEVGLARALVPRYPGITSAMGCLIADMRHDRVQTINLTLDDVDFSSLTDRMREIGAELAQHLEVSNVPFESSHIDYEFDMSYLGQTHAVTVPLNVTDDVDLGLGLESVREAFSKHYIQVYGRTLQGQQVRINALRVTATGVRPGLDLKLLASGHGSIEEADQGEREIWFDGGWQTSRVYDRLALPFDAVIEGPAVLEQADSTIIIDPDLVGRVDALGNLLIERRLP